MKIEGNHIRLFFDHAQDGLMSKGDDKLQGFAIAGEDRKFVWAEAMIDGKTVVVSSPRCQTACGALRVVDQSGVQPLQSRRPPGLAVSHGCLAGAHTHGAFESDVLINLLSQIHKNSNRSGM
jgi:hypothetical protein